MLMATKKETLKSQVYRKILTMILQNDFEADSLIVESQLTKMFNVSRAPVREALIELCQENILKNIPRAGYQVVRISEKDMRDALYMRLIIELEGLKLAFPRLTKENIRELKEVAIESDKVRASQDAGETLDRKMQLNDKFHLRLNELSGNLLMARMLKETMQLVRRGVTQTMIREYSMELPVSTFHSGLVKALEKGDLDSAVENLRNDILSFEQDIKNLIT
ncbi:transcriptional regulator, GntR family [Sediminispirochaeta smaragdinae DSM 11293]|uniref:Transcriptional regulator, GntR family n=2 Tax=Sediminispirochaeta TaxID=1911556 RepID=E1R8S4_SEDSS|nr:transcriptional regulator, GntR family [Sediminispirochaeta smaragdinae DSM 11293]